MISAFEIYKIGIGPSSSHTVGPMFAAYQFTELLQEKQLLSQTTKIVADIYGSLSLTGKGHQTDTAIIMGLAGNQPATVDIENTPIFIERVRKTGKLPILNGKHEIDFPLPESLNFKSTFLPLHENGLTLSAYAQDQLLLQKTYYSIGGGAIVSEDDFGKDKTEEYQIPYPFSTAEKLLKHTSAHSLNISSVMMQNELTLHTEKEIKAYFDAVSEVMKTCIERGMKKDGLLPGPYRVPRRAADLYRSLTSQKRMTDDPMQILDWVNVYAFAVSEENAAGGRVVTAPTNGACGVVPAVLAYYDQFVEKLDTELRCRFYLTTAAIGILYKKNASISGAEVGCQGEIGVACSMAAAGLTELFGGSPAQVCIAAEIAMEHNLGLTCDPVGGQVQVPCIERNAIAAVKAINASRMALRRTSTPMISLDKVIQTMYETGKDLHSKYRETSQGGLAIIINKCE